MARISSAEMRALEAVGVIVPLRADTGWRTFCEADVAAVAAWRAQRAQERAVRAQERTARIRSAGAAQ
jgi:hypothetical protein